MEKEVNSADLKFAAYGLRVQVPPRLPKHRNTMGKHIKTSLDYTMIEDLAKELFMLDPTNKTLTKYLSMDNFEGAELRKCLKV